MAVDQIILAAVAGAHGVGGEVRLRVFAESLDSLKTHKTLLAGDRALTLKSVKPGSNGAIARFAPVMTEVVAAAGRGMPVLGICNGFQILCESHLLPGALIRNDHRTFVCRDQRLRIENNRTPWTSSYAANAEVTIVLKNGEGGFIADEPTLERLEGEGRVVARYLDVNPNGSLNDIAGLTNPAGNVVGLMPHPEHATEPGFGPDTREAMRSGTDGLVFFRSVIERTLAAA